MKLLTDKFLIAIIVLFTASQMFLGCVTQTESLLQEVYVDGIPIRHPIKITENREAGNVNIRANLSFNNNNKLNTQGEKHTRVNEHGVFQIEEVPGEKYFLEQEGVNIFDFEGENVHWNIPDVQTRVEFDIAASRNFAVSVGLNYSKINEKVFWGESIGFAFWGEKKNWGYRFDVNLHFYKMGLSAEYAVIEATDFPRRVIFIFEDRTDDFKDLSFGYTMNTNRRDWLINVFFNYTLGWQTLYDFRSDAIRNVSLTFPFLNPSEIYDRFEFFEAYHSFSAGLYKNIFDMGRIVFGARYTNYTDTKDQLFTPDYFIQYEIVL
jgi:hypothetical protein